MPPVPRIPAKDVVKAFCKIGFIKSKQEGSHIILTKPGHFFTLSIPNHDIVGPGLLKSQITKAGITVEEFCKLL